MSIALLKIFLDELIDSKLQLLSVFKTLDSTGVCNRYIPK